MNKFVSGLPLTQAERERDAADKREALERQRARHKAMPSGQRYRSAGTPQTKRNISRMIGERDDD